MYYTKKKITAIYQFSKYVKISAIQKIYPGNYKYILLLFKAHLFCWILWQTFPDVQDKKSIILVFPSEVSQ